MRKVGAWGKRAFNTVNSHLMGNQLMGHGIYKSPFIRNGSSGTVVQIVDTTVCLLERSKEGTSVTNRSNIMENGLFDVSMGFRFLVYHLYIIIMLFLDCCSCSDIRFTCFQEPVAVAFSALSLAIQFHGWISFFILLYYKLPLRPNKRTYYEFTGLWHIYGVLAMNFWFWSAVFHSR